MLAKRYTVDGKPFLFCRAEGRIWIEEIPVAEKQALKPADPKQVLGSEGESLAEKTEGDSGLNTKDNMVQSQDSKKEFRENSKIRQRETK